MSGSGKPERTPLYDAHVRLKARMVDFHGWEMPIQYAGIIEEHLAVRTRVGLFDLSHMGRVRVQGKDRRAFLQKILTINVDQVPAGKCRYTFYLNEKGTVIDDLILYAGGPDDLLVVNASNRPKDLEWMRAHLQGDVTLVDETFTTSLIAIQGPRSVETMKRVLDVDPSAMGYYTFTTLGEFFVSRTGYTGEDGFEIFVPASRAVEIWNRFIDANIAPIGLGARDTLRTEAAMPLYGNDIDDQSTPLEAGLNFAIDLEKPDFIGQAALKAASKPARRLTGLVMESKRIPRQGFDVFHDGKKVGNVTSGTWSPALEKAIAMAYLPAELRKEGTPVEIDVRGRREKAVVVKLPFYRRKKS
ncbi:MAG TPA: glycine cleavage system aminomethyltransferase GcvT [Planctomycetota bacterium]|jgi:aminomethyltransferase|nr:glycine cleavage system aminomethyltransferase GcvT [Planctomycetota bacterium]